MASRSFRLHIIFRAFILVAAISWFTYYILVETNYLRSVYLLALIAGLLVEFFYYIDRTNRDISNFLTGILQKDFSTHFSEKGKGKTFNNLYQTLNQINQQFKNLSSEKEAQYLYLETLVEHVKIGIISFNEKGEIHLINQSMKKLLDRPHLHNIQALGKVDEELLKTAEGIEPSETRLVKFINDGKLYQLSVNCSVFKIQKESYKLLSFQNIKNELEAHELETWQKLIRVLTHEIMNSVAPITSLTSTLQEIVGKEIEASENTTMAKVGMGLEAIKSRSQGLQKFTETYRSLTKIPPPKITRVPARELMESTLTLMQTRFVENGIKIHKHLGNDNSMIYADKELFQQVLINILNNAVEALQETSNPEITIMISENSDGKQIFSVRDNGPGIPADNADKIFIPFFTTKKEGSGIGLALSRQILQLHNASINVESKPETGTVFSITI